MQSFWKGWMVLPLLAVCGAILGLSCENTAGQCELTAECTGAPGVVPGACDPNIADGPIPDTCGTFVSASASPGEADGSPARPFTTFEQAIEAAASSGARVVYACAETFTEAVVLPADFVVYGGLDCKNGWILGQEARTTIAPDAGVPITFEAGETIHVENVQALAPDGAPPDPASENPLSGGSSIAAIARPGSKVELLRCDLVAGDGAPGTTIAPDPPGPAAPGGDPGEAACAAQGNGGKGGKLECEQPTHGGDGGNGGQDVMLDGSPGLAGGAGGTPGSGQLEDGTACTPGAAGSPGMTGEPGEGGKLVPELLDAAWKGSAGADGKNGRQGNGGGGGGGGKICTTLTRGAGGGGGGAGGCGGTAGKGGGAGGSSIALWAVDAGIALDRTTLVAGTAGGGAKGGDGQKGALGGNGGVAGQPAEGSQACDGGDGGNGGDGGPGGGGQGGSSIAVVWKKTAPTLTGSTVLTPGTAGGGGQGGENGNEMSNGAAGLACTGFDTDKGECVSP